MKERKRNPKSLGPNPSAAANAKLAAAGKTSGQSWKSRSGSYRVAAFVTSIVFGALVLFFYWNGRAATMPRSITPLPVARVTDLKQFHGEHRERMFWGTYRPHLYLGIRTRTPQSLLAGLMWIGLNDGHYAIRHTCEQGDRLTRYAWLRHDGATYGRQELVDQGLLLSTSFLKSKEKGSGYGGDWAVRIRVDEDGLPNVTGEGHRQKKLGSVFFYVAEEAGRALNLWPEGANMEDAPFVGGVADEMGEWQLHARHKDGVAMNYVGLRNLQMESLSKTLWSTLEIQARTKGVLQLPNSSEKNPNLAIIQFTGTIPFDLDVVFVSGVDNKVAQVNSRVENLTGSRLENKLAEKDREFEDRFEETFKLHEKTENAKEIEVGKVALSNMVGSIGYFYGQSRISIPPEFKKSEVEGPDHWLYWPAELFSAVPSRSFFPRGFLWDEGFHQLVISRWDRNISLDIMGHWLDLINIDGWIPREQILGDEARSKVPEEFINQHTSNANPPALLLVLHRLALQYKSDLTKEVAKEEDLLYFKTIFPRLEAWFNWFNTTQIGKLPGTYYWHGRDQNSDSELNPKTLSSGLDDYPRASHPSDEERHLDLWCWMAQAAKTLSLIANIAGEPNEKYEITARRLSSLDQLNEMHFDSEAGRYYDYGKHTEKVHLKWQEYVDSKTGLRHKILRRAVLNNPKLDLVRHVGYVSFFPFIMGILPHDSPLVGDHLEMLHNHQLLWSDYGLRSLATNSSMFMKRNTEHDAPYWRGPIWINMNYLILSALHEYATVEGPHKKTAVLIYSQLRQNLIRNIVEKYHRSGYLWENYRSGSKGEGQGSHPFTGWTSLVLLIMGEMY